MTLLDQAKQAQLAKEFPKAESLFQQAMAEAPRDPELWYNYGLFALQQGETLEAKQCIEKSLELETGNAECYIALGNIAKAEKEFDAAMNYFQKGLAIDAKHVEIHNSLGTLYYQKQDFDKALKHYIKATYLQPDYAQAHFNLGLLFIQQGKIEHAIKQFNNVLSLLPDFVPAARYLGDLFLQQQNFIEAKKHYETILDLKIEDADVYNNLGVVYLKQDQWEEASQYFTKAILADNKHIDAKNNLATVYLQHERFDNAIRSYQDVLALKPEDLEANYNLGVATMAIGELEAARQQFEKVIRMDAKNIDARVNLAAVLLKLDERKQAIKLYEEVLVIEPNQAIADYMLKALKGAEQPVAAPEQYVENLFDNYAGYYEKHMGEVLRYTVPEKMEELLKPYLNNEMDILDLGCGSGLAAEKFKAYAKSIIGIDLSNKMLKAAAKKTIYANLIHADLAPGIQRLVHSVDLIIAADVFVYLGSLREIFHLVHSKLSTKGLFCFSTELGEEGYQLQVTARYTHSIAYIEELAEISGFEVIAKNTIIPRYQDDKPIQGMLYLLTKL